MTVVTITARDYRRSRPTSSTDLDGLHPSDFDTSDNVPATLGEPVTPGRMLRALRELAELTQAELGARTGIGQTTISSLESGRETIGVERAERLAEELGVHPGVIAFAGWRAGGRDGEAA